MDPTVKNIYFNFLSRSRRQIENEDFRVRIVDRWFIEIMIDSLYKDGYLIIPDELKWIQS
jgi:hypothetical protein